SLSSEARVLGAVNCVVNRRGKLLADNTDARGLEIALREAGLSQRKRAVGIIGAGGGAAAAVLACSRLGAREFVLFNRTATRAHQLAKRFPKLRIRVRPLIAIASRDAFAAMTIVVNATTIGLRGEELPPIEFRSAPSDCLFYDLIYAREP